MERNSVYLRFLQPNKISTKQVLEIWSLLEQKFPTQSPFLNIEWFGSWFNSLETKPMACLLYDKEDVVGITVIGEKKERRLFFELKTALINQVGVQHQDQAWIEYNDIICAPKYHADFITLLRRQLSAQGFDRLYMSMADLIASNRVSDTIGPPDDYSITKGYLTNLSPYINDAYPSDLSKNTKNQLRRSIKKARTAYGDINVQTANDTSEKELFLDGLATNHRRQWSNTLTGSGFDNDQFNRFVQNLLFNESHRSEIIRITAGSTVLGYSINLILNTSVFFYCSGINHSILEKHIKPGYTFHYYAIKHYASKGFLTYDFLGGDGQYKKSLSSKLVEFQSSYWTLETGKGRLLKVYYLVRKYLKALLKPSPDSHQQ